MFKRGSQCICSKCTLLWSVHPLPLLSFTPSLPSLIIQQLSIHTIILSTFTDVMYYNIVAYLSFSFSFPPPWSFIEKFHYFKHVLHVSLYIIMFGFLYMFIFWIYLPHMRENICPLSFSTWFTLLNTMSSNCIHLPSNHVVSFFFMAE
jgi:hypothetical protein